MTNVDPLSLPSRELLNDLVRRANDGDSGALTDLRKFLDDHPEIWQNIGDLARHAQESMLRAVAGKNQLLTESLRRGAEQLRIDLQGDRPANPVESLAIERVVAAWTELQFAAAKYPVDAGDNLPMARFVLQLKESTQRRFDAAMRSLLLVREKLADNTSTGPLNERRKKIIRLPTRAAS